MLRSTTVHVTKHALRRYRERVDKGASVKDVKESLILAQRPSDAVKKRLAVKDKVRPRGATPGIVLQTGKTVFILKPTNKVGRFILLTCYLEGER